MFKVTMNHFGFQVLGPTQPAEAHATSVWHKILTNGDRPLTNHYYNRQTNEAGHRDHQPLPTKSRRLVCLSFLQTTISADATSQQPLLLHRT
jgi:hypothetical protein